jgi:hypothetical protein
MLTWTIRRLLTALRDAAYGSLIVGVIFLTATSHPSGMDVAPAGGVPPALAQIISQGAAFRMTGHCVVAIAVVSALLRIAVAPVIRWTMGMLATVLAALRIAVAPGILRGRAAITPLLRRMPRRVRVAICRFRGQPTALGVGLLAGYGASGPAWFAWASMASFLTAAVLYATERLTVDADQGRETAP